MFMILGCRTFYVQKKYNPMVVNTEWDNSIEKEHVGNYNYLLLDRNGKDLNTYKRKYKVIIDGKTFSANAMNQNLDNFINFNYIIKEEIPSFEANSIMNEERVRYDISKKAFEKISLLSDVKGIYAYEYDEMDILNNWKIESILMKDKGRNGDGIDNYKKDKDSLEGQIVEATKDNKNTNIVFEKDLDGIYKQKEYEINEKNKNMVLTLDKEYQEIVRSVLNKEEYSKFNNIGVAIVKSKTGEVLALGQKDEFAPNIVTGAGHGLGYEPGSVFKVTTLAAAMEYNDIRLSDTRDCTGIICRKELIHGKINIQKAMEVSCNDIFAKLGAEVGFEKLQDFAMKQGYFDKVLNLDIKTGMEVKGDGGNLELAEGEIGIGQSILSTPMQVVGSLSTIMNDGEYIKPYILKEFENTNGDVVKEFDTQKEELISKETAEVIRVLLRDCVDSGSGIRAKIEGVEIGGKTGTTQSGKESHGWFLGYFELDGEFYNMVVFLPNINEKEENGVDLGGGNTAAPIFKDIVLELLKK